MQKSLPLTFLFASILSAIGIAQITHPTQQAIEHWLEKKGELGCSRATIEICMVTVNDTSDHNIIYWDKTTVSSVDYFKIYREDATGSYMAIDSVDYDSLSEYHDFGANPDLQSYRYKISAVDLSGIEGPLSLAHKTIFCDEPSEGDFAWNDYEIEGSPSPVIDFIMLREDNIGTGWHPVDTVSSSILNFTDIFNSLFPFGSWRVRTIWPITCTPTRAGVSTSRSNVRTKSMLGLNVPSWASVAEESSFIVFPNPSSTTVTIKFISANGNNNRIIIRDVTGKIIDDKTTLFNHVQINVAHLSPGTYLIEGINSGGRTSKVFIRN